MPHLHRMNFSGVFTLKCSGKSEKKNQQKKEQKKGVKRKNNNHYHSRNIFANSEGWNASTVGFFWGKFTSPIFLWIFFYEFSYTWHAVYTHMNMTKKRNVIWAIELCVQGKNMKWHYTCNELISSFTAKSKRNNQQQNTICWLYSTTRPLNIMTILFCLFI